MLEREVGDHAKEEELLTAGLSAYSNYDKLWMMAAQAAERRSDLVKAREHYLRGLDKCAKSTVLWSLAAKLEETASGIVKARPVWTHCIKMRTEFRIVNF